MADTLAALLLLLLVFHLYSLVLLRLLVPPPPPSSPIPPLRLFAAAGALLLPPDRQGYAFNTFGEVFACWVQDIVLIGLIFRHLALSPAVAASAAAGFVALCAFLFSGGCPLQVLALLQLSTIGMMALGSRLPQILLNIRRGNAGMLSVTTCGLNVAGNVIRLFTTSVLTQDWSLLAGAGIQGVMNSILLYQSLRTELGRRRQQAATGPAMGMA